jgi:hypothetical protein
LRNSVDDANRVAAELQMPFRFCDTPCADVYLVRAKSKPVVST